MTTVQITFHYQGDFRPDALFRTRESHCNYGIRDMRVDATNRLLTVEYDAARVDAAGVAAVLRRCGIAITERAEAQAASIA